MTVVNCRVQDCVHQLEGVCQQLIIEVNKTGQCMSFTHIPFHERRPAP